MRNDKPFCPRRNEYISYAMYLGCDLHSNIPGSDKIIFNPSYRELFGEIDDVK
jgi:hypothetical protein